MAETVHPSGDRKRQRSLSPASQRKNYVLRLNEVKNGAAARATSAPVGEGLSSREADDERHSIPNDSEEGEIGVADVKKEKEQEQLMLQGIEQHDVQTTIESSVLSTSRTASTVSPHPTIVATSKRELISTQFSPATAPSELPYPANSTNRSYRENISSQASGHNPQASTNPISNSKPSSSSLPLRTFDSYYENQLIRAPVERKFFIQNDLFDTPLRERFCFSEPSEAIKCFHARVHISFGRMQPPAIELVCYVMENAKDEFSAKVLSSPPISIPGLVKKFSLKFFSDPTEIAGPNGASLIQDLTWKRYDKLEIPELPETFQAALRGAAQVGGDPNATFGIFALSWKAKGAVVEGLDDTALLDRMVNNPFPTVVRHMLQFLKVAGTRGGEFKLFFVLNGKVDYSVESGLKPMVEICNVAQQTVARGTS